jgi:hypothetical protein
LQLSNIPGVSHDAADKLYPISSDMPPCGSEAEPTNERFGKLAHTRSTA